MNTLLRKNSGFTLIEVLLVVALIAILAGIVIVAINPSRQIANTNNTQRTADVNTILNAVYQYAIDNNGALPFSSNGSQTEICATDATSCSGLIDLDDLTDNEVYLVSIPIDPTGLSTNGVGYTIATTSNNRVTVEAPDAENGEVISVTR